MDELNRGEDICVTLLGGGQGRCHRQSADRAPKLCCLCTGQCRLPHDGIVVYE